MFITNSDVLRRNFSVNHIGVAIREGDVSALKEMHDMLAEIGFIPSDSLQKSLISSLSESLRNIRKQ